MASVLDIPFPLIPKSTFGQAFQLNGMFTLRRLHLPAIMPSNDPSPAFSWPRIYLLPSSALMGFIHKALYDIRQSDPASPPRCSSYQHPCCCQALVPPLPDKDFFSYGPFELQWTAALTSPPPLYSLTHKIQGPGTKAPKSKSGKNVSTSNKISFTLLCSPDP